MNFRKAEQRAEKCTLVNTITLSRVNNLKTWLDEQENRRELLVEAGGMKIQVLKKLQDEAKKFMETKYDPVCNCSKCYLRRSPVNSDTLDTVNSDTVYSDTVESYV